MELTRTFVGLSKNDAPIAGGKGASLGEMTRIGIPVPSGYVILSCAFDHFLEEADLVQEMETILGRVNHNEVHTVERASEEIQGLILNAKMPEDIGFDVTKLFKELDVEYVAVRSSATAEDGAEHAWAGQLDSYLNTTEKELLKNVQRCWASLFTPRAIFYRFEKGLYTTGISVAVVVQKMVNSEVSGVAFSVHPITEDRNQLIIEAGFGLGEAIVSGQVTPDSYVVEKTPRKLIDKNISTQTRALCRAEGGGNEWRNISETRATSQVLSDEQVLELSELVIRIENHYSFPCDIEWAYEKGEFYITQSRPITTLSTQSTKVNRVSWKKLWSRDFGLQFFYAPVYGFGVAEILSHPIRNVLVLPEKGMQSIYVPDDEFKTLLESLKTAYIEDLNSLKKFIGGFLKEGEGFVKESSTLGKVSSNFTNDELGGRLSSFIAKFEKYGAYLWATFLINELMNRRVTEALQALPLLDSERDSLLEYAVSPSEPAGVLLLSRESTKKDLATLSREFDWITTLDIHTQPATEADIKERITHNVEVSEPEMLPTLNDEVREIINLSRQTTYLKDVRDDFRRKAVCAVLPLYDVIADRVGAAREDLSYLSREEILGLLSGASTEKLIERAKQRRATGFALLLNENELVVQDDPEEIETLARTQGIGADIPKTCSQEIRGVIGQKGRVRGRVVVVNGIREIGKVTQGSIMCTVTTNPDYLPAMQKAAAFITDEGGTTCHAAIVARELRKPCIVGTGDGTKILHDGDEVEVDANEGLVRILKKLSPIRKEDYLLAFWAQGVSIFVTDIHFDVYKHMGILFIIENGRFKQYFLKEKYEQALDDGVRFYSNEHAVLEYRETLERHCIKLADLFDTQIKGRNSLSQEKVREFFEYVQKLVGDYTKMNFEFTDKAFSMKDQNKVIENNLAIITKFKDEVRAVMNKTLFEPDGYVAEVWNILSKQFGVEPTLLDNLTQEEVLALFDGTRPAADVTNRQNAFVYSYAKRVPIGGAEAEGIVREFEEKAETTTEFHGQTANKGKAQGRVKVIPVDYSDFTKLNSEIERMKEGEILVAETTAPELLLACRKAAAIITDLGGLMSHAAIVSREFGIPCIVGTKNASKILKDGDEVDVDADAGVVRLVVTK